MSTEATPPAQFAVVHGAVWPREGGLVDVAAVREHLIRKGLVAALGEAPGDDSLGESVPFSLLVRGGQDDAPRVALLAAGRDGEPVAAVPGPWAHEAITDLVAHVAVDVELGGVWWDADDAASDEDDDEASGDEASGDVETQAWDDPEPVDFVADDDLLTDDLLDDEDDAPGPAVPGDVIVSHQAESGLPMLANGLGSGLWTAHTEGWTLTRCDEAWLNPGGEGWLPSELPVLQLKRSDETNRVVEVLTRMAQVESHLLRRHGDMTATVAPEILTAVLDHPLVDALTNPHLADESDLHELLATKHFAHLDAHQVAAALQTPMDDRWSSRVLTALGAPALAGDVHEGRVDIASLPGARRFEVTSMLRAMGASVSRYYDAPEYEVASRTWVGRFYAALVRTPLRVALLMAIDIALVVALSLGFTATDSIWLKTLAVLGILGVGADAVMHGVLAPKRFRTR